MPDLRHTLIRPAAWAFYVVLVFEILLMISPAALFFYSVYGPVLGFLNGTPVTAWLTQFLLPHIAATGNPVLDHAHVAGELLIVLGRIVFLAGAVPLYWSKVSRRGVVTGGIHGWSRNPIYLGIFLIYGGIGIAASSLWALILTLPLAITIRYGVVAREERYLERRFGYAYRNYKARVRRWL